MKALLESLAAISSLTRESALTFALQCLAWGKYARTHPMPLAAEGTPLAWVFQQAWQKLAAAPEFGPTARAFSAGSAHIGECAPEDLHTFFRFAEHAKRTDSLYDVVEGVLRLERAGHSAPSPDLVELITELAEIHEGTTVYCPFDNTFLFSLAAARKGAHVFTEASLTAPVAWLINILFDGAISAESTAPGDREPPFSHKHDVTIGFLPAGRYQKRRARRSHYSSPLPPEIIALQHVISVTKSRAVLAMVPRLLFGTGMEKEFRRTLVERGCIESVIALPRGLLSGTSAGLGVLALNFTTMCPSISMVDATRAPFTAPAGRKRTRIPDPPELAAAARAGAVKNTTNVSYSGVVTLDYSLEVRRYFAPEDGDAQAVSTAITTTPLHEFVDFFQPLPTHRPNGDIVTFEVGQRDIPEYGYIGPGKKILMDNDTIQRHATAFLRPHDLVFITKGNVGKVGIAPPHVPPPGPFGYAVSQNAIILRVKNPATMPPPLLLRCLRSPAAQEAIERETTAATTTRLLQISKLRLLPVVIPHEEVRTRILEQWEEQVRLEMEIRRLRERQHALDGFDWATADKNGHGSV